MTGTLIQAPVAQLATPSTTSAIIDTSTSSTQSQSKVGSDSSSSGSGAADAGSKDTGRKKSSSLISINIPSDLSNSDFTKLKDICKLKYRIVDTTDETNKKSVIADKSLDSVRKQKFDKNKKYFIWIWTAEAVDIYISAINMKVDGNTKINIKDKLTKMSCFVTADSARTSKKTSTTPSTPPASTSVSSSSEFTGNPNDFSLAKLVYSVSTGYNKQERQFYVGYGAQERYIIKFYDSSNKEIDPQSLKKIYNKDTLTYKLTISIYSAESIENGGKNDGRLAVLETFMNWEQLQKQTGDARNGLGKLKFTFTDHGFDFHVMCINDYKCVDDYRKCGSVNNRMYNGAAVSALRTDGVPRYKGSDVGCLQQQYCCKKFYLTTSEKSQSSP